jgi:hypothetical protein
MSAPFLSTVPTAHRSSASMTRPMQAQDALPVPQSISMQSMYLAVSLELPLGLDSWGLSLSMFEGNYLIIGDAREEQAASMVRGFWSAYTPLDPAVFCRQFSVNVASFTKYLFRLSYSPTPRILLPGDCILAINGRPISHFASLAQATACFRQDRQLSLLILRHPVACAQARSFLLHQPVTTNTMTNKLKLSREYGAARCAYWIHCKSKSTSTLVGSPLQVPLQTKQSPLVRVVTVSVADKVQAPVPTGNATPLQVRKSPCTIARPRPALCIPTNPLFRDSSGQQPVHYFDNYEYDPDEGLRSQLFLRHVDSSNFSEWLHQRKQQWRGNYKVYTLQQDLVQETNNTQPTAPSPFGISTTSTNTTHKKDCVHSSFSNASTVTRPIFLAGYKSENCNGEATIKCIPCNKTLSETSRRKLQGMILTGKSTFGRYKAMRAFNIGFWRPQQSGNSPTAGISANASAWKKTVKK